MFKYYHKWLYNMLLYGMMIKWNINYYKDADQF